MPRLLTKLRIDEVSSVDRGAGEGVRVVLMKRDADDSRSAPSEYRQKLHKIFRSYLGDTSRQTRKGTSSVVRSNFMDTVRCVIDLDDPAQQRRALLTTKHGQWLRGQFPAGTSLDAICDVLASCRKGGRTADTTNKRSSTTMRTQTITKAEALSAIVKNFGVVKLCKMIAADGDSHGLSEAELTRAISDSIQLRDGESREQAFARAFTAMTPDGLVLRKAVAIAKMTVYIGDAVATQVMDERNIPVRYTPRTLAEGDHAWDTGTPEDAEETGEDDQDEALDVLHAAATKMQRDDPSLTHEQAFAKVFTDPKWRHVAARERAGSRQRLRKAHGII